MPADYSHIDLVLQYALLSAAEQDALSDRQLGAIHLIKYVYLADLYHAKKHEGLTYTGTAWQFYKFGPWSQSVNERIEPALISVGADKQSLPSNYEEQDWVRWYLREERLLKEKEHQLPPAIKLYLSSDVLKYGKDTQALLHYVYSTKPMLSAAPGERLDFLVVADDVSDDQSVPKPLKMDSLSNRKKEKFKERIRNLGAEYQNRQQEGYLPGRQTGKLINPVKSPRYDGIYHEGITWLDSLAGTKLPEGKYVIRFSDEVWKTVVRKGEDVS